MMETFRSIEQKLKEGIVYERKLRRLQKELAELRSQYGDIVHPLKAEGGRSNLPSDPVGKLATDILEEEERIVSQIQETRRMKKELKEMIETFCIDDIQADVLIRRYVYFQDYDSIAEDMMYEIRNIFKLRRKGIQLIVRTINNASVQ